LLGGVPGLVFAALIALTLRENLANFVPGFAMTPGIAVTGLVLVISLGLITGIIPALNAMRLRIAAALGRG
jgi:putative ABC transport system permease protein